MEKERNLQLILHIQVQVFIGEFIEFHIVSHGSFSRVIIMFSYKSFVSLHWREIYTHIYTRRSFSFHSVRLFTRDYVMKDRWNTELFDASAVAVCAKRVPTRLLNLSRDYYRFNFASCVFFYS